MDSGFYHAVPDTLTPALAFKRGVPAILSDYISLLKPRVVLLHFLTATTSMLLAAGGVPNIRALTLVLLGGGLTAGAANTFNCYFDRELDKGMPRTENRPLPAGRLAPHLALAFGLFCAVVGLSLLALLDLVAAALALSAFIFYVLLYTLWLKRNTGLSAVFSSGIGAVPPLIGWIAVTGRLAWTPVILFAIIALWTPPHFWSLAMSRGDEYERAGLFVLPRTNPAGWIFVFIILLIIASTLLTPAAHLEVTYAVIAVLLGLGYLILSLGLNIKRNVSAARSLYLYSIFYLVMLFAAMIASLSF